MDIYFRQYWYDYRLKFDHLLPDLISNNSKRNDNNKVNEVISFFSH